MSNSKVVIAWRRRIKAHILEAFKSQCGICGYNKYQGALELHHLDPSQKDFAFCRVTGKSWDDMVTEAKKCVCVYVHVVIKRFMLESLNCLPIYLGMMKH